MAVQVSLGDRVYTYPSKELGELADHTALFENQDWGGLRTKLTRLGYVRIKGLHDREVVLKARRGINII